MVFRYICAHGLHFVKQLRCSVHCFFVHCTSAQFINSTVRDTSGFVRGNVQRHMVYYANTKYGCCSHIAGRTRETLEPTTCDNSSIIHPMAYVVRHRLERVPLTGNKLLKRTCHGYCRMVASVPAAWSGRQYQCSPFPLVHALKRMIPPVLAAWSASQEQWDYPRAFHSQLALKLWCDAPHAALWFRATRPRAPHFFQIKFSVVKNFIVLCWVY